MKKIYESVKKSMIITVHEPEVSPNHSSLYYSGSVPSHPVNKGIISMMSDNNKDPFL